MKMGGHGGKRVLTCDLGKAVASNPHAYSHWMFLLFVPYTGYCDECRRDGTLRKAKQTSYSCKASEIVRRGETHTDDTLDRY